MSAPKLPRASSNYNNYFINPELRYKKRTTDPKTVKANLANDDYLYNNLHNNNFNHWRHPFVQPQTLQSDRKEKFSEEDVEKLIAFKQHL